MANHAATGFWHTVLLLLKTSRVRAVGRQCRQQELLNQRKATNWGGAAVFFLFVMTIVIHIMAAYAVISAVEIGQRLDAERQGRIAVSQSFLEAAQYAERARNFASTEARQVAQEGMDREIVEEAHIMAKQQSGDEAEIEHKLRAAAAKFGSGQFVLRDSEETGLSALGRTGNTATLLGSLMLLWWFLMIVCQGEGLELDLQRRRHPMWEWLFTHPVHAGAIFLAEMLAPLSANPFYWTAPIFVGILFGTVHGAGLGLAATILAGIPLTIAAACAGKALEIGAILRLPVRSRGAVIGILGWFGFASTAAILLSTPILPRLLTPLGATLAVGARAPLPLLGLFLGQHGEDDFSFVRGIVFCWGISLLIITFAIIFSARSIKKGLNGAFASDALPGRPRKSTSFGREPLFRKEYLWFIRDRSAIVQTILIPVTIVAFQMFNMRAIFSHAQDSWNYLCGAAILFGTYFLWILGPKSLTSEGSALWIAMTWPRGLESMLKAKAWHWSTLASGLVVLALLGGCLLFPQDSWKIALVAIAWFLFARSMAEKAVTLVEVVSESGEAQKIPAGRRWAAQLGMLTFAIGVCTQQWSLAIVGIVYSWITAAAMWENLRARLPYLYDPWSEHLPEPPTLMHAMVSISVLIECASVITMLVYAIGGRDSLGVAQGIGYAVCAVGTSLGVVHFLEGRGVPLTRVVVWQADEREAPHSWFKRYIAGNRHEADWLLVGFGGGVALALLAHLYLLAAKLVPSFAEILRVSEHQMHSVPGLATAYAIIAIGFAPFAEEFLFRGLVFRALDRQWGGWKAVFGSAVFFAIYHAPLSWLPVGLVGAANCLLFKRSGRLAPAIVLHMAYNAVVTLWN